MISKNIGSFPVLKLPMSKKTKDWKEACVNYIIGKSGFSSGSGNNGRTRYEEMLTYYDLYNSIYNEKDLLYVTNPFKLKDGFPATAQDYNIIKPKVDLLLGEETKRPFNFRVVRTSDNATSDIQERAKLMLTDYIMGMIMANMGPEEAMRFQQAILSGEIMPPELIQKYLNKDYKDIAETTAYHSLNYLKNKLNITHEFYKGWKDALIAGEEIYYVGIINGNPYLERVNPLYFSYDQTADLEFIHDSDWCCRKMIMSATEIYDRFYDKMSEKQLNELLEMIENTSRGGINPEVRKTSLDYPHIKTHTINGFTSNPFEGSDNINVWHCCWKSFKKIGFVTYLDPETGEIDELQVDESYKVTGLEINVEWSWIIEVWEGYRVGEDLYIGIQPLEYQHISADNLNSLKLPYTGVVYNNTNSSPRSLVSMMKPLQYMYIVLWYRLELAMSRDKGKVPVIDVTLIPKSMGIDVNKWMHYLGALGVVFINPYEEGWDIPGREGGKPSLFNLFLALDLSMANTIDLYINLMNKIEDMVSEISGVSKQREGYIASNELVGNVERSVVQSAHITEPWFWVHNLVKKEALTMLLDTSKVAWKDNKRCLHYILDDATRAFITLSDEFFYEDMDVFVDDTTKNQQQVEALKQLMQPAMQNGASLLDIAEIITMDNINMIKQRLEEIEQKRMEQQQQMEQAQAEREMQMQQMQNEMEEEKLMIEEAKLDTENRKLDLEKYKIDTDANTKIAVAQLNAYRGAENMDQDMNGIPDPIEIGKQAIEQQKVNSDIASKQFEFNNKKREMEMKREIENKKIELEKQKMKQEMELQKLKDKEAYKREQLKAKTARANRVVGEK
ncbi:portal protein [uncultured phage cr23_1]|uniref:portal protein n=1 Tax=uncultured phage cr23_1 TaxID=2986419 RepID=UPI001C776705|nr:portal protein [uncultured phage cr23_1]